MATTALDKLRTLIKVRRPKKLSDPHWDFSEQHLVELLAKGNDEYDGVDYRLLFGPYLPAGTYAELVYFIPLAFAYFANPDHQDLVEMSDALIGFTADEQASLEGDGLFEAIGQCFQECFEAWTKTFTIMQTPFDRYKVDVPLHYIYIVPHLELLVDTIHDMLSRTLFTERMADFVQQLARNESDPIKAAWFLSYTVAEYDWDTRASRMFGFKFEPIESVILDSDLLKKASDIIRSDHLLYQAYPNYWKSVFETLGLA